MQKKISTSEMTEWKQNFSNHDQIPFVTKSALISLKDLEDFIATIKNQGGDCVRVNFIRFEVDKLPIKAVLRNGKEAEGCKWRHASDQFTQATIVMAPAKNFQRDEEYIYSADDIIQNNQVTVLLPGTQNEGTGLNPPSPPQGTTMK